MLTMLWHYLIRSSAKGGGELVAVIHKHTSLVLVEDVPNSGSSR